MNYHSFFPLAIIIFALGGLFNYQFDTTRGGTPVTVATAPLQSTHR